ncbi:hypothetical protein [Streptomyces sp. NPDC006012]|uniref:SWIM zinc finger family protein n=1 Tax=Streptomyces sp. NPDC006012 TaxID=3364739 RepID=UPI00368C663B
MTDLKFGTTAWGRSWVRALESLGATYPNPRLVRGRSLARKGAVTELVTGPGAATAHVDQGRRRHQVALRLRTFTEDEWHTVLGTLAGQVRHAAALLDGRLPADLDDCLRATGSSLAPRPAEIASECSCGGDPSPCVHAIAVHYLLAARLDRDPFVLLALRGRDRTALLADLRAARTGRPAAVEPEPRPSDLPLDALPADRFYTAAPDALTAHAGFRHPDDPTAFLRRLGPAPEPAASTDQALSDAVRRAAALARALCAGDATPPGHPAATKESSTPSGHPAAGTEPSPGQPSTVA